VTGPGSSWLLDYLGQGFTLLSFGSAVAPPAAAALLRDRIPCRVLQVGGERDEDLIVVQDVAGLLAQRYDGKPGTCYLLRPDQIVCARWRSFDAAAVRAAIAHATAHD
jgi:3-(3-hydroxy-phenyl)propionate hydroxylase